MQKKLLSHPCLGIYQANITDDGAQEFSKLTGEKLDLRSMEVKPKSKDRELIVPYNPKSP